MHADPLVDAEINAYRKAWDSNRNLMHTTRNSIGIAVCLSPESYAFHSESI